MQISQVSVKAKETINNAKAMNKTSLGIFGGLNKIPEEIFELYDLLQLELSNNQIKQIPKEICNLKKLQYLDLHNNEIDKIPEEIGQLENLEYLILNDNNIKQLPRSIGNLKKLRFHYCPIKNYKKPIICCYIIKY